MRSNLITAQNAVREDSVAQYAVPATLGSLSEAISILESNAQRLHDRLDPVLSTEPSRDGEGKLRASNSVPLAEQLSNLVDRIESLNYRMLDVLDRLHV
jgi:hypothetical protein